MTVITGTSDVNVNVQGYLDRAMLMRATPALLHQRWVQIRPVPKNSGTKITFRRVGSLAVAGKLTEGTPPTGKKLQVSDIYATLFQTGDFIRYTDWLSMTSPSSELVEMAEVLGEQAGLTLDTFARDEWHTGTMVRYANDVAGRTSIDKTIQLNDAKAVVRILEGLNCKKVRKKVVATDKVATQPVRPSYIGITHTDCRQDWENLAGFIPVENYASQADVEEEEIGTFKGIRVMATTNAKVHLAGGAAVGVTGLVAADATNVDVYNTLVFGADAFGSIPLQKKTIKNIVKELGRTGFDPLDQVGTSGWKAAITNKILNDNFVIRIEHGATDL